MYKRSKFARNTENNWVALLRFFFQKVASKMLIFDDSSPGEDSFVVLKILEFD